MPYFVVYALDKSGMSDLRATHRPAHRARLRDPDGMALHVHTGGPLTDEDGQMIGTMLVVEAASKSVVERFLQGDPYSVAGVYDRVDIRPYAWGLGQPNEVIYG